MGKTITIDEAIEILKNDMFNSDMGLIDDLEITNANEENAYYYCNVYLGYTVTGYKSLLDKLF